MISLIPLFASAGISFVKGLIEDHGEELVKEGIKKVTGIDLQGKTKLTPDEIKLIKEAELKLRELDFKQMELQVSVNMKEAEHPHLFVAGWRPAVGWVGVISLFFMYVPKAIVMTMFWVYKSYLTLNPKYVTETLNGVVTKVMVEIPNLPPFPDLGNADIIGLLASILGVGAMRSFDKKHNTDTKNVSKGK